MKTLNSDAVLHSLDHSIRRDVLFNLILWMGYKDGGELQINIILERFQSHQMSQ